ncbi:helix-turn-helix domain-containing protein [Rickettsiella endosymbiont of Dermanyssus gallinae]|uniref:helix-turn-helix domain-containing protein n=1 Tax=Rickettsiella endosymbiont of Dermanyssus gallinae TaxID=2856608 RepID=UPI001C533B05|nr:helix-turn-helix domain-containing protein [Rickettsiella endosymbiont of Dermanyssus gallinae]
MKTFNLEEAAQFLKMSPGGLRRLAASKKIPAAKPGRGWCFLEEDLVNYVRSLYDQPCNQISQGVSNNRRETWHSTRETEFGGLTLLTMEKEYNELLGRQTKRRRRNCMID